MRSAVQALDALRALPCGARALEVLERTPGGWIVGGAVRDALLGTPPREIDIVVEGDPEPAAHALGEVVAVYERFGTYDVADDGCLFDVVRARAESYAWPGALPDVRPSTLDDDLARRDFTINTLALSPSGDLRSAPSALDDLAARRLRVLHEASFIDDPTRLWRLVRYAVRLDFVPEPETDRLAAEAVRSGALQTVSGDRLGAELRLALGEPNPLAVLHAAQNLGLAPGLRIDPELVADALALLPSSGARPDLTLLGAVLPDPSWPEPYNFTAPELHILQRCAALAPVVGGRPSEVSARLRGEPIEAVAVAGARGDVVAAGMYLAQWRHVGLEINGRDLLRAGIPEGPEIGRRLQRVLALRLDGELGADREAQLGAALEDAG